MKREEINDIQYHKIMAVFMEAFMKNGLKSTSIDSIANTLQMSKRTLYEIFGSKEEMFKETHRYFHNKMAIELKRIFDSSDNIMEAIVKSFLYNRDFMSNVSFEFIQDLEKFSYNEKLITQADQLHHYQHLYNVLQKGVDEGYFINEVNLAVQCRMLLIQMKALKRTQEIFPEDVSLLEVYDSIIIGFLRGISSEKGLREFERIMPIFKQGKININSEK